MGTTSKLSNVDVASPPKIPIAIGYSIAQPRMSHLTFDSRHTIRLWKLDCIMCRLHQQYRNAVFRCPNLL